MRLGWEMSLTEKPPFNLALFLPGGSHAQIWVKGVPYFLLILLPFLMGSLKRLLAKSYRCFWKELLKKEGFAKWQPWHSPFM